MLTEAKLFTEDVHAQKNLWENFKAEFKPEYADDAEEKRRFGYFLENLKIADERQLAEHRVGGSAVHGVTVFSDLTDAEFKTRLGFKRDPKRTVPRSVSGGVGSNSTVESTLGSCSVTSSTVDWTGIYTSGVRSQGYCGSCWTFATAGQVQADYTRTYGGTIQTFSPEQLVQCSTEQGNDGCNGGDYSGAYQYLHDHSFELDANYPYTSYYGTTGGPCAYDASKGKVKTLVADNSLSGDESCMAHYVQTTGPLAIAVDASSWSSYWGGIMSNCGDSVDHAVQIVGVKPGSGGYWKIRNSWGTYWGESGFIRLAYGQNTCDLTYEAWYSSVSKT